MTRKLQTYFDPDTEFEAPLFEGETLKRTFAGLQDNLVTEALGETETLALHGPLKQAANEAAGLAWTTPFPLLVFPTLFNEKVETARQRVERAQRIKAQTADFVMEAVV
jgi:hypothetical protein